LLIGLHIRRPPMRTASKAPEVQLVEIKRNQIYVIYDQVRHLLALLDPDAFKLVEKCKPGPVFFNSTILPFTSEYLNLLIILDP
jgi:hypothetical protein